MTVLGKDTFADALVITPISIPGATESISTPMGSFTTEASEVMGEPIFGTPLTKTAWWKVELPPDLTADSGESIGAYFYFDATDSLGGSLDPIQLNIYEGDGSDTVSSLTWRHTAYFGGAEPPGLIFMDYDHTFYIQVGLAETAAITHYGLRVWYEADEDEAPTDSTATLRIMERYGTTLFDQVDQTTFIDLLSKDLPSSVGFESAALSTAGDGSTTYSFERWIRLDFVQGEEVEEEVEIANVRMWFPDLDLQDGWTLKYGVTDTYQQPTRSPSSIATISVPSVDPGETSMFDNVGSAGSRVCQYIVLQASVNGDAPSGPMQGVDGEGDPIPLNYHIHWTEI